VVSVTILTPEPLTDETRTPRWSDARDQMIHACALQEHIIANAPVLPVDITVHCRRGLRHNFVFETAEFDVRVYLHRDRAAVEAYQVAFGGDVSESTHDDGAVYVAVSGNMFGCRFEAWTLLPAVSE
jgi:hypothetical protein